MSDLVDEINRLEAWVRNYGHEKQPEFIADLKTVIGAAKAVTGGAAVSEAVKITLGTRVVVEIGGVDFDLGKVYELTWAPVDDYVFKIASPDGTVSKIPVHAGPPRMHLTLCCEAATEQEGQQ